MQEKWDPWVWKIPWRRKWQPTPVFLPGKNSMDRGSWWATDHGVARVGHDWVTKHAFSFSPTTQQWSVPVLSPWISFLSVVTPGRRVWRCFYFWYPQARTFPWIATDMINCLLTISIWMSNGHLRQSWSSPPTQTYSPHTLCIWVNSKPDSHSCLGQTLELWRSPWLVFLTCPMSDPVGKSWQLCLQNISKIQSLFPSSPEIILVQQSASFISHLSCSNTLLGDLSASALAAISLFSTLRPVWSCARRAGHITPLLKSLQRVPSSFQGKIESASVTHKAL